MFDARGGVTVDGTTQPGYALRPLIGTGGTVGVDRLALPQIKSPIVQVFGNGLTATGLVFTANDSTLRGLHVWGFTGTNVAFTNANDAEVLENLIGANARVRRSRARAESRNQPVARAAGTTRA